MTSYGQSNLNEENIMTTENAEVQQQEPEATVKIELTVQEVNVIFAALQELPHRVVDGLIKNIAQQAQSQLQQ